MRAVAVASVLMTGCFYIDPIVPPPSVHLAVTSADPANKLFRGGPATLSASFGTDAQQGWYTWAVYSCSEFDQAADACDGLPFFQDPPPGESPPSGALAHHTVNISIPPTKGTDKTRGIKIVLDARSDRGARATLDNNNEYGVADAPPSLQLDPQWHSLAAGAPIDLVATYGDVDSDIAGVALGWTVSGPDRFTLEDLGLPQDPGDPAHRTVGKRLTPSAPGTWAVQVTATDAENTASTVGRSFAIVADSPPCLAQWSPAVPPAAATLPISEPTFFQVPLVSDDLDAYPPITDAPQFGTTAFAWSIRPPGATQHQPVTGATSNGFKFDPALYTPGDVVELRVEIFDRIHTAALPCDDAAATCSIASSASCLQRQTWRVEVR